MITGTNAKKENMSERLPANGRVIYYYSEMKMSRKSSPSTPELVIFY